MSITISPVADGSPGMTVSVTSYASGRAPCGIRNSGTAVEVNSTGIAPPYAVQAIGNEGTLASRLVETDSGAAFGVLAGDYGWSYDVDNVDDLRLPAAPPRMRQLRSAHRLEQSRQDGRLPEGDG